VLMRGRWWVVVGLMGVVGGLGASVARASVVSPTPASSWQTDGRVRALAVVGDKVFLGGDFTHVRPPGAAGGGVVRDHLAALSLTTGKVLPWNPGADGSVLALRVSPDGKTVYIGGSFTTVGGAARANVAAVSTKHVVVRKWHAHTKGRVDALVVTSTEVFMGGAFSKVDGRARASLAAVGVGALAPLRAWAPRANAEVRALVLSPSGGRVFAGGDFTSINGHTTNATHLAALAVTTGAPTRFAAHPPWTVTTLRTSATRLYAGGSGNGGHVNSYDSRTGSRRWSALTDGAVEAMALRQGVLYVGGRFANYCKGALGGGTPFTCTTPILRVHLLALSTSGALVRWTPGANSTKGVSAMSATSGGLQVGGDFTKIGGITQQGFARFK